MAFESRGLPKNAPKPIVYLSGFLSKDRGMTPEQEVEILWDKGCVRNRMFSHAFCGKGGVHYSRHIGETLTASINKGMRVSMDSGAFSFHQVQRAIGKVGGKKWTAEELVEYRERVIATYVEFCRKHSKEWDFYVTFDYKVHAPTVWEMTKKLEKMGMRPTPVFHGDDTVEWLTRYCQEGHKLICIGGKGMFAGRTSYRSVRNYYDVVFNIAAKYGVGLHGLAQTAMSLMFQYPFQCCDSATWARNASHGCILNLSERSGKIEMIHVSDRSSDSPTSYNRLPRHAKREIERMVEQEGFEFKQMRTSGFWRSVFNAKMFSTKIMSWKETIEKGRVEWASLL